MSELSPMRVGSEITAEEFEHSYAAMVGTTVEQLHADGRLAEPCICDWHQCRGWALGYRRRLSRASRLAQDDLQAGLSGP